MGWSFDTTLEAENDRLDAEIESIRDLSLDMCVLNILLRLNTLFVCMNGECQERSQCHRTLQAPRPDPPMELELRE
jgi:hypothetical protein